MWLSLGVSRAEGMNIRMIIAIGRRAEEQGRKKLEADRSADQRKERGQGSEG